MHQPAPGKDKYSVSLPVGAEESLSNNVVVMQTGCQLTVTSTFPHAMVGSTNDYVYST